MDIGVGDWVEAVRDWNDGDFSLATGRVYQVVRIFSGDFYPCTACGDRETAVHVHTDPADAERFGGWCRCDFRPIYRPKADLIESLKQPAPKVRAYGPGDLCINGERVATVTHVAIGKSA